MVTNVGGRQPFSTKVLRMLKRCKTRLCALDDGRSSRVISRRRKNLFFFFLIFAFVIMAFLA